MKSRVSPIRLLFVWIIRGYQMFISPVLPGRCKYYPSCSQYAIEALREFGVVRGGVLAAWRILRCNPMSYGGYDPVERQRVFRRKGNGGAQCVCCGSQEAQAGTGWRWSRKRQRGMVDTGNAA